MTSTSNGSDARAATASARGSTLGKVGAEVVERGALGRGLVGALGATEVDQAEDPLGVRDAAGGAPLRRAPHARGAPVAAEAAGVGAEQEDERRCGGRREVL